MTSLISGLLPLAVLASHFIFAFVVLAYIFRASWGGEVIRFIRAHGLALGLALALSTVLGSLFYSIGLGYPPCELCSWQRVFLFPQAVLFLVALKQADRRVFDYSLVLSLLAAAVALYQINAQSGGFSVLDCTAAGGDCLKVYVKAYGYITIPVMGLTSAAYLALLSFINRKHESH